MTNATAAIRQSPQGAWCGIRVYTVSRADIVSPPAATVTVPYGCKAEAVR
jgi:hypothetical protein